MVEKEGNAYWLFYIDSCFSWGHFVIVNKGFAEKLDDSYFKFN